MKKMKAKLIILGFGIVALTVLIGKNVFGNDEVESYRGNRLIAMYVEDENGEYVLTTESRFPTEGYVLNLDKSSCKNGGVLSQNEETKAISLKVSDIDQCNVYFDREKMMTLANGLKTNLPSIVDYEKGEKSEMYAFDHPETNQTEGWSEEERRDYRYIGESPNNYIEFNDEVWRIIGVFTVETENGNKEQLIKIMSEEGFVSSWDYCDFDVDVAPDAPTDAEPAPDEPSIAVSVSNKWEASLLYGVLNDDFYNNERFVYTHASNKEAGCPNGEASGLNSIAKSKVAKVKFYLGAATSAGNGDTFYNYERGSTGCMTNGTCETSQNVSIFQNVGLIYPSDFLYTFAYGVSEEGYNNSCTGRTNWMTGGNIWTQTIRSSYDAYLISYSGCSYSESMNIYDGALGSSRPTLYLKSNTVIIGGNGSKDNPYKIQ